LTAVEFLGEFYLDGDGRLVINCDGKVRLYAVLFSPFGGVNSPPCFLDLSLTLARCCVLQGAITARIYVDDGYGSGRLSRTMGDADGSVNRVRGAIDEFTAEEALLFWCILCAILGVSVAPHKIELGLNLTLLGLFVQVSRNHVRGEARIWARYIMPV
jgi:hypothetical protein